MVYCAEMVSYCGTETIYVPIINILHSDPQFGVSIKHYHIDGRFATQRINQEYNIVDGKTNFIIHAENTANYKGNFVKVVLKPKVCKRLSTGILPPITVRSKKYWEWYDQMMDKEVKGDKCPHHGTLMLDRGNKLVCPLHGLHVCKTTKKVIKPNPTETN